MTHHLLVVGGNGFLGSSVCKAAVKKGWQVTSISTTGQPFRSPKGHTPAWVSRVNWRAASAFEPSSYASLLAGSSAVVHTIGTLFENTTYKDAIKTGSPWTLFNALTKDINGANPLGKEREGSFTPGGNRRTSYRAMNYESAMTVLDAYLKTSPSPSVASLSRAFVYISAEDIFSPFVPRGYIKSKRDAEKDISAACQAVGVGEPSSTPVRPVSLRPGLMYHPHLRPLTTPLATLLSVSAESHRFLQTHGQPSSEYRIFTPTPPATVLQGLADFLAPPPPPGGVSPFASNSSSDDGSKAAEKGTAHEDREWEGGAVRTLRSVANAMSIPPLHVDHVAQAACDAVEFPDKIERYETSTGGAVLGVREMREFIGWAWSGEGQSERPDEDLSGSTRV